MTATKVPLSLADKKTLKKTYNFRLAIGLFFICPIVVTSTYMCFQSIAELGTSEFSPMSLFGIGFFILCFYLFFKLAVPFYKQTFKNIRAEYKLIIETRIIDIKTEYSPEINGHSYTIQTESHVPIRSTVTALLNQTFGYKDMRINMKIRIHCMEDNPMDILYIEPLAN
jgi:hypothetical protein